MNDEGDIDYYPFGMEMDIQTTQVGTSNDYTYNGKEMNSDFGLNLSDYGARWYDASIGRWHSVDPLAEMYGSFSTYNYVLNNPMNAIDPNGMSVEPIKFRGKSRKQFNSSNKSLLKKSMFYSLSRKRLITSRNKYAIITTEAKSHKSKLSKVRGFFSKKENHSDNISRIGFVTKSQRIVGYDENGWEEIKTIDKEIDERTVYEETIHAAQYDFYGEDNSTALQTEVEMRVIMAMEGLSDLYEDGEKDVLGGLMENVGDILNKIPKGEGLSEDDELLLGVFMQDVAKELYDNLGYKDFMQKNDTPENYKMNIEFLKSFFNNEKTETN
ncbi:MAG: RHS repeat-associated protein [Maribacter sp.]